MLGALVHPIDRLTVFEAGTAPMRHPALQQRLVSAARATLEIVAAALAGDGHRDAAERTGAGRRRTAEVALRRLPAVVLMLVLALVVLAAIGALLVVVFVATAVASLPALSDQSRSVALR